MRNEETGPVVTTRHRPCPGNCGHSYFQVKNDQYGDNWPAMAGGSDIFVSGRPATCSHCGTVIKLAPEELLDIQRYPEARQFSGANRAERRRRANSGHITMVICPR